MPDSKTSTRVTALVAVLAVLVVIVGATLIQVLGGGSGSGGEEGSGGGGDATGAPVQSAAPETPDPSAPATAGCEQPPAPPATPKTFDKVPDKQLARAATWKATVSTNCGDIVFELYGDKAPQTVSSFIFLARHGYWKDSPCHRLVPQGIFVLQCGDPTGTGTGDPGYGYGIENAPADGTYPRGTLAMARTADPNSNGGQFFIVFQDTELPVEGGGYSIFGKVVQGMDIVDMVAQAGVGGTVGPESPAQPISILDVSLQRKAS
ncbi:MAG TPA: peptidylprolyl isomerase [Nocardioidaceae bacterium]|nr:peptidylprolyl isomerase [Nocardioidaceae bacterium]